MNEVPQIEFDKRLNYIGLGVFAVLFVLGCIVGGATWFFRGPSSDGVGMVFLGILGLSGLIGLAVHVVTLLALTPIALYLHHRNAEGMPPLRAVLQVGFDFAFTIIGGFIGLFMWSFATGIAGIIFGNGLVNIAIFVGGIFGAVAYDRHRRRIRTIDLSTSRELI